MSHQADTSTYPPYLQAAHKASVERGPIWVPVIDEGATVDPFAFRSSCATVREGAVVGGETKLSGNAEVMEGALVSADVHVSGDSIVGKHAKIESREHYMSGQLYGFWWDAHRTMKPNEAPCVTMRFGCRSFCIQHWTRDACRAAAYEMSGHKHEELAEAIESIVDAVEALIGGNVKRERLREATVEPV